MPNLHIYGSSDDLIEFEGRNGCSIYDEYNGADETFLIASNDGRQARVRVHFEDDGVWSISVAPVDEDIPGFKGDLWVERYSTHVSLDVPEHITVTRIAH